MEYFVFQVLDTTHNSGVYIASDYEYLYRGFEGGKGINPHQNVKTEQPLGKLI